MLYLRKILHDYLTLVALPAPTTKPPTVLRRSLAALILELEIKRKVID